MKSKKIDKQAALFELIEGFVKEMSSGGSMKGTKEVKVRSDGYFEDPRTGAKITHVHTNLKDLLKILNFKDNFFQRKIQNHLQDKIYKNLIISILQGHLIPELRVAVLNNKSKVKEFDIQNFKNGDYRTSIIDGLQRYCCFLLALFITKRGQELIDERFINKEAFKDFEKYMNQESFEKVANANIRLEVYLNIEVIDLLKYMIIFNTAQRRMSLNHQMEIMQGTILQNLQERHKAEFVLDRSPTRQADKFLGAELVFAIQAYLQKDHMLSKNSATDDLFEDLKADETIIDEKIDEVSRGVALMTKTLHPLIREFYAETEDSKYMNILTKSSSTFVIPMMASLGRYIERKGDDPALISKSLGRIITGLRAGTDVLRLEEYYKIVEAVSSSRGSTIKNLAYRAFLNYWTNKEPAEEAFIDWKEASTYEA